MKYQAVIFDLFGTLVDNFDNTEHRQVLANIATILGAPPESFTKLWRGCVDLRWRGIYKTEKEGMRSVCKELGVPVTKAQLERAVDVRMDYSLKTIVPRSDTLSTINQLKDRGYKVGLISDCSPEAPAAWPRTPFNGIFDVTVFSCEAGMKKPDPRIYHLCCERLGVKPEDCLYVGDGSSTELTGALGVGMHPIMIRDPSENADTDSVNRENDWQGPRIAYLNEVLAMLVD
jgi:putative hydrolase of the HAD superfamily